MFHSCVHRGSGVGAVMALGCVGRLSSPLMNLRNHYGYFLHHVVYSSLALLAVLSILLLPESKRKPLPQTLVDGEQYAVLRWSEDVGITFLFWLRQTQRPSLHSSTANTEGLTLESCPNNPVFVVIPNTCRWSRGTWTPSWSVRGEGYRSMSTEYANACQRTVA